MKIFENFYNYTHIFRWYSIYQDYEQRNNDDKNVSIMIDINIMTGRYCN